jgi:hypothetical protein
MIDPVMLKAMSDPVMFRQLTEIKHQERLDCYARPRRRRPRQKTAQSTVFQQVHGAWTALLVRLSLAAGH